MDERDKSDTGIQHLLAIEGIADAAEVLRDYEEHQKNVQANTAGSLDEAHSHTRYYAESSVEWARRNLWEIITDKAFAGELSFDQTVDLLKYFGFDAGSRYEADYSGVLARFVDGEEILLKQAYHHYPEGDLRGHITGDPFIAPYADRQDSFRAMIYAEITVKDTTDGEMIPIVTRDDRMTTPTVVVGREAIETYLQNS